jgi:hypothetical protein
MRWRTRTLIGFGVVFALVMIAPFTVHLLLFLGIGGGDAGDGDLLTLGWVWLRMDFNATTAAAARTGVASKGDDVELLRMPDVLPRVFVPECNSTKAPCLIDAWTERNMRIVFFAANQPQSCVFRSSTSKDGDSVDAVVRHSVPKSGDVMVCTIPKHIADDPGATVEIAGRTIPW